MGLCAFQYEFDNKNFAINPNYIGDYYLKTSLLTFENYK